MALGILAGFAAPLLTWWVSGPIMAVCAVVAAWGFWPLIRKPRFDFFDRNISLRDAATRLYEAVRGTDIGREFERRPEATEDEVLDRAALHIIEHVPIEAKHPPSTRWEPLSVAERNKLMPRGGATGLGSIEGDDVIYTEPRLQRKDLWPLIRDYKASARP
jgi:hypothetical protein